MLWVVRGTYGHTGEDVSIVVEAETRAEAEYMAIRRSIPVVIVGPATAEDVTAARETHQLYISRPEQWYTCFGQPVGGFQLACLMLCGVFTALTVLHSSHVLGL